MLYLEYITDAQALFIPKSREADGGLSLRLRNSVGRNYPVDVAVIDLDTSERYYNVAVTLPEGMDEGEYEYTLSDSIGTLSEGIAVLRVESSPEEYDKTIQYEQYRAE